MVYELYIKRRWWFGYKLFAVYNNKLDMLDEALLLTYSLEIIMWREVEDR